MPIFDMTLSRPLSIDLMKRLTDFVAADRLGQVLGHRGQRLEREIGIDRFGAIAGETGEMMDLARFAGLDDEADRGAKPLADQVMMHGRSREQGGDRDAVRPDHAIGKDDDVVATVDRRFGALAKRAAAPRAMPAAPFSTAIGDVKRLGVERIFEMADAANLLEILVGQDRLAHLEPLASRGAVKVEQIGPRSDEGDEAHHQLFADRIDRRVGHLSEVLLEIGVKRLRLR